MLHITGHRVKRASKTPHFLSNIEQETLRNQNYRKVLFTTKNEQLVLMNLRPKEEIGMEAHNIDQFFRFEAGQGQAILNGETYDISNGDALIVPKETQHNIINTSQTEELKLYTIYSPPNHRRDVIHKTKADEKEEHFDGETDI